MRPWADVGLDDCELVDGEDQTPAFGHLNRSAALGCGAADREPVSRRYAVGSAIQPEVSLTETAVHQQGW